MNAREVAGRLYGLPAGELNWPALSEAVLGRCATRAETVGRIAELLEGGAGGGAPARAGRRDGPQPGDTSPNIAVRSSSAARGTGEPSFGAASRFSRRGRD